MIPFYQKPHEQEQTLQVGAAWGDRKLRWVLYWPDHPAQPATAGCSGAGLRLFPWSAVGQLHSHSCSQASGFCGMLFSEGKMYAINNLIEIFK